MNKILFIALLVTGNVWAVECPWEKPYKCKVVGYSQYQCGCGVEWAQSRAGINSSYNPYIVNAPTVNVTQAYTPPRYIRYDGTYNIYSQVLQLPRKGK